MPNGDPAVIFDRALTLLLAQLERKTLAQTDRPRASGKANPAARHIPAAVKRAVWARDEGRCAFVGSAGRCTATRYLEFHHVVPFAEGGPTAASNLQLRCRTHNAYEAEMRFGRRCVRERSVPYWPFRNGFPDTRCRAAMTDEVADATRGNARLAYQRPHRSAEDHRSDRWTVRGREPSEAVPERIHGLLRPPIASAGIRLRGFAASAG